MARNSATATIEQSATNGANEPQSTEPKQPRIRKIDPMPYKVFASKVIPTMTVYGYFIGKTAIRAWVKVGASDERQEVGFDTELGAMIEGLFTSRKRKNYIIAQFVNDPGVKVIDSF